MKKKDMEDLAHAKYDGYYDQERFKGSTERFIQGLVAIEKEKKEKEANRH